MKAGTERVCDWCDNPNVITKVRSRYGLVELCWDCTLRCLASREPEKYHAPYRDHVQDAIRAIIEAENAEALENTE